MARQSKGFCKYCGKEYTRGGMYRHMIKCAERKKALDEETGSRACGYFQILLYAKYNGDYWLLIEMRDTATLADLDQFIRDIWVECCGHLSAFNIGGQSYESHPDMDGWYGTRAKGMNCKLKNVMAEGLSMSYEYDFGSTTELVVKVLGYRSGFQKKDKVTLLSRNIPPEIYCSKCGKNPAQWILPEGFYNGDAFRCEACLEEDEEEEFFLPVCNSPRIGVCDYEGSSLYPDVFMPDGAGTGKRGSEEA